MSRLFAAAVLVTAVGGWLRLPAAAQDLDAKITVDGTPLITSQPVVRQGNEWLVPLLAIARALSVTIEPAGEPDTIRLRRANGVEYTFNARTGEIRSRYVLIGRIDPNPAQLRALNDEIMFPLTGVVALLGVNVQEDANRNIIAIESNRDGSSANPTGVGGLGSSLNITSLNYNYGLTSNFNQVGQIASFEGSGLVGGARVQGNLETTRRPGAFIAVGQASLRAELRPQSVFLFGDQSTYSGLDALTVSVRGLGYEGSLGSFSSYYYAGRGRASTAAVLGASGINTFDTTIGGFSLRRRNPNWEVALAGNTFHGPSRSGVTLGAALSRTLRRNQLKIQTLAGRFSGTAADRNIGGAAYGFVISNTFTPAPILTITAQTEHYSRDFLTARDDTRFSGTASSALGVTLRPIAAVSLSGGVTERSGAEKADRSRGFNYGAQYAMGGRTPVLLGYFRNVTRSTSASNSGKFDMAQYSVNIPKISTYSISSYYSRILTGGSVVRDLAVFGSKTTRYGQLGFRNQVQFGHTYRYGVDWLMDLGSPDTHLRFGADQVHTVSGKRTISPNVSLRLPFFGDQTMQVRYSHEPDNHLFQLELTGPLIRRREVEQGRNGETLIIRTSDLKGRVYFDINNDGRFEESVDKAVTGVMLSLDGSNRVLSDEFGEFRFAGVAPGAHRVKVDLAGVPADLVLAEGSERTVAVTPYRENTQNFRVLQMGRVVGKVTYLDYSEGIQNPVERGLPDARILVGSSLDTYTETNGAYIAGDLVPGEYLLAVDPATIPEGYVVRPDSVTIQVKPGQTDETAYFQLSLPPRPVIERTLPVQEVGVKSGPAPETTNISQEAPTRSQPVIHGTEEAGVELELPRAESADAVDAGEMTVSTFREFVKPIPAAIGITLETRPLKASTSTPEIGDGGSVDPAPQAHVIVETVQEIVRPIMAAVGSTL